MHRYQPSNINAPYTRKLTLTNGCTVEITSHQPLTMVWISALKQLPERQYTYLWPNPKPTYCDCIVEPIPETTPT